MDARVHIFVTGRVQGVFFRANTESCAVMLELRGFVRNLDDGRVEVIAEGEESKINELIKFIKNGPGVSRVSNVEVIKEPIKGEFTDFSSY